MTVALLVALLATNVLWLLFWHVKDCRDRDERQVLLDRIERPGEVVIQRETDNGMMLPAVGFEDDEEFNKVKNG